MKIEIGGVAEYMADGNDFYSPYYRHITLDTWAALNEDTIDNRYMGVSFQDVLVPDGFDCSYLPNILDVLNVGDYHGAEPWLYSECLRENIKQRIRSYRLGR